MNTTYPRGLYRVKEDANIIKTNLKNSKCHTDGRYVLLIFIFNNIRMSMYSSIKSKEYLLTESTLLS